MVWKEPKRCERCKEGHYRPNGTCSYCGSTDTYPVRRIKKRRGRAGGKRGRNSGKVSQHGKAKG